MNRIKRAEYLRHQILAHIAAFFKPKALEAVKKSNLIFTSYDRARSLREPAIAIPVDIDTPLVPGDHYQVPFNDTFITVWNPIPLPDNSQWESLPNPSAPLWYRNSSGTLIPAWNIFANLFDLLTFREDREIDRRDRHGRFIAAYSPRLSRKLLETPAFNEAAAALAAAAAGMSIDGYPSFRLNGWQKKPVIILSHDCDLLRGNDLWTQGVRLARVALPLRHAKFPRLSNLRWIAHNALSPRDFYFRNAPGMINLERMFNFTSTFYLLNGIGGRFGARSGSPIIKELLPLIPDRWDLGMHYNYDTFLDQSKFEAQKKELSDILGHPPRTGRAHYLRFDAEKSLPFLESNGLTSDESSGYPDYIGYRNGIGGTFNFYDIRTESELPVREIPMIIMDATLLNQYRDEAVLHFDQMLFHLSRIGGALSLVVHPGFFFNPEFPERLGLYHKLLVTCRKYEAASRTALSLSEPVP